METRVWVNGFDLADFRFYAERWDGDFAAVAASPALEQAVGAIGARVTGGPGTLGALTLTVRGHLLASTADQLNDLWASLVHHCAGGANASGPTSAPVTLRLWSEFLEWEAYLTDATKGERGTPAGLALYVPATLTFVAPDPARRDATATVESLGTTVVRCPVGTAPSAPVIVLNGPIAAGVTRIVSLLDGANQVRGFLHVTPSVAIGVGESIEIDMARETVTQVVGSTRTLRAAWVTDGDFWALSIRHRVGGVEPGAVLDAGTGSISYRRRYR